MHDNYKSWKMKTKKRHKTIRKRCNAATQRPKLLRRDTKNHRGIKIPLNDHKRDTTKCHRKGTQNHRKLYNQTKDAQRHRRTSKRCKDSEAKQPQNLCLASFVREMTGGPFYMSAPRGPLSHNPSAPIINILLFLPHDI